MTKISFLLLMMFMGLGAIGQSLNDVNALLEKQKYGEAKTMMDKMMTDPKNSSKSDSWYYKGRVYNALSNDKATANAEAYELKLQAFDAFQKNQQMDAKDIRMKVEGNKSYLDVYYGMFDLGARFYNDKDYANAFNAFSKATMVKDFILSKKYEYDGVTLYPLDTALTLNTAIAAMQAKNEAGAVENYRKLTDASVGGDTYREVYEYLADYYFRHDDEANLMPFLTQARKMYPENDYWSGLELDAIRKKGDRAVLFAKYEDMMQKEPNNYIVPYNYAIELFNAVWGKDEKPANMDSAKTKLTEALAAAIKNDKAIDATVLMTKHLYNISSDMSIDLTKMKGTKPDDLKKKAALAESTKTAMNEFLTYAKKASAYYDAQDTLKPIQRATYQELLTNMSEIYTYLKDTKAATETDKRRKEL